MTSAAPGDGRMTCEGALYSPLRAFAISDLWFVVVTGLDCCCSSRPPSIAEPKSGTGVRHGTLLKCLGSRSGTVAFGGKDFTSCPFLLLWGWGKERGRSCLVCQLSHKHAVWYCCCAEVGG